VKGKQKHEGADPNPSGAGRYCRQDWQLGGRPSVVKKMMFTRPNVIEAQVLSQRTEIEEIFINVIHSPAPRLRIAKHRAGSKFHEDYLRSINDKQIGDDTARNDRVLKLDPGRAVLLNTFDITSVHT
jgi:hypothetical protein